MDCNEEPQPFGIGEQRACQHPDIVGAGRKERAGIAEMIIGLGELSVIAVIDLTRAFRLPRIGAVGRFLPREGVARHHTIEWLMWQMGGFGPTLGHAHYFLSYNHGRAPFAEELFRKDTVRLYQTLDGRLDGREYLVDGYSVADMAVWPWVSRFQRHGIDLGDFPNVCRWYLQLAARPQVKRGYEVPHFTGPVPLPPGV